MDTKKSQQKDVCQWCGKRCYAFGATPCRQRRQFDKERRVIANAVLTFAERMKARMLKKHSEGYTGWDDASRRREYAAKAAFRVEDLCEDDWDDTTAVDAANYLMMVERIDRQRKGGKG